MCETPTASAISPETKLGELLNAYPQLEGSLSEMVPAFGKLKPGMFRDAIARVTSLEQAVASSNLRLPDVIVKLNKLVGIQMESAPSNLPGKPMWASEGTIVKELDARPLLAQGIHPKDQVISEVNALDARQIFVLITPFVPGPLIEIAKSQGCQTWTKQKEAGRFETYFGKS